MNTSLQERDKFRDDPQDLQAYQQDQQTEQAKGQDVQWCREPGKTEPKHFKHNGLLCITSFVAGAPDPRCCSVSFVLQHEHESRYQEQERNAKCKDPSNLSGQAGEETGNRGHDGSHTIR